MTVLVERKLLFFESEGIAVLVVCVPNMWCNRLTTYDTIRYDETDGTPKCDQTWRSDSAV